MSNGHLVRSVNINFAVEVIAINDTSLFRDHSRAIHFTNAQL